MGDILADSHTIHAPKLIKLEPQDADIGGMNLKCLVCDEDDAGRHYGSICCSGCKGFFRRTVRFNKGYTCPYRNQCIIRKEYRNCCRACRYQKCLDCGLNPMLVHGDRGTTKFSKPSPSGELPDNLDEPYGSSHALVLKGSNRSRFTDDRNGYKAEVFDLDPSSIESIIIASKFLRRDEKLPLGSLKIIPSYDPNDYSSISKYFMLVERLCDTYVDCEIPHMSQEFEDKCSVNVSQSVAIREPRLVSQRSSMDWEPKFYITSKLLRQSWCRIVVQYLDWASHIPELQELDERDQENLIIGRCVNGWLIKVGYITAVKNLCGIPFSGGAYMPVNTALWSDVDPMIVQSYGEVFQFLLSNFVEVLKEIEIKEAEYSLFKVINMFMPITNISEKSMKKLHSIKLKYMEAFNAVVYYSNPGMQPIDVMKRVGRLMELHTIIEKAGRMIDDIFTVVTLFNWADLRGSLPYDMYIRKNDPKAMPISSIVPSL